MAAAPKSTKRALIIVGIVMVVGLIVTAILIGGALKGTTIVNNLDRGDCVSDFFQNGADGEYVEIFLVQTSPCSEAHALEVFAVTDLLWSERDYPGVEESFTEGQNWCFDQYDSFVGGDYETSPYDVWTFVPVQASWAQGDRTVQCLVGQFDEITLTTGSLEGAGW